MIAVVDSGLGNARSVLNMVMRADFDAVIARLPEELSNAKVVVLPGVGAFDAGVRRLRESGLGDALMDHHERGGAILGICLGMQLLAHGSEEGAERGLGLVDATFEALDGRAPKVPHVGWNRVLPTSDSELFAMDGAEQRFYFVHSYAAKAGPDARVLANVEYGVEFPCAYQQGNVFGVQFHPEKSHAYGLNFFTRFLTPHA